jgi:hypothetical protein
VPASPFTFAPTSNSPFTWVVPSRPSCFVSNRPPAAVSAAWPFTCPCTLPGPWSKYDWPLSSARPNTSPVSFGLPTCFSVACFSNCFWATPSGFDGNV